MNRDVRFVLILYGVSLTLAGMVCLMLSVNVRCNGNRIEDIERDIQRIEASLNSSSNDVN